MIDNQGCQRLPKIPVSHPGQASKREMERIQACEHHVATQIGNQRNSEQHNVMQRYPLPGELLRCPVPLQSVPVHVIFKEKYQLLTKGKLLNLQLKNYLHKCKSDPHILQ